MIIFIFKIHGLVLKKYIKYSSLPCSIHNLEFKNEINEDMVKGNVNRSALK